MTWFYTRGSSWPLDRTFLSYVCLHWQVSSLSLAPPGKWLRCKRYWLSSPLGHPLDNQPLDYISACHSPIKRRAIKRGMGTISNSLFCSMSISSAKRCWKMRQSVWRACLPLLCVYSLLPWTIRNLQSRKDPHNLSDESQIWHWGWFIIWGCGVLHDSRESFSTEKSWENKAGTGMISSLALVLWIQ